VALGAAMAVLAGAASGSAQPQPAAPASVSELAGMLTPTVVNISSIRRMREGVRTPFPDRSEAPPLRQFFDQLDPNDPVAEREVTSLGSGFVIDPAGIIATNYHVIEGAEEIIVVFADGETAEAQVVGADEKTDLAIVSVDLGRTLAPASFGDSDTAEIGDWVMAIGNPFGFGGSVSLGIVSARNRDIHSGPYDSFLQTDAAINQGNSGGPLFDMNGEVVGINTAIIANGGRSLGVGFAIPINLARPVLEQLMEFGETRRGWLGVGIQDVSEDIAASLGLNDTKGAMVLSVTPDGPADGVLREGDLIFEFDGRTVTKMRDLPRIVAETAIGKRAEVVIFRNGEERAVDVTVGRLERGEIRAADLSTDPQAPPPPKARDETLGLELAALTDELRKKYSIAQDVKGVIVVSVDPGSDAYEKGIRQGLVIAEVNQHPVGVPEDATAIFDTAMDSGREAVLFMLADAAGNRRFVAVRIDR